MPLPKRPIAAPALEAFATESAMTPIAPMSIGQVANQLFLDVSIPGLSVVTFAKTTAKTPGKAEVADWAVPAFVLTGLFVRFASAPEKISRSVLIPAAVRLIQRLPP
jgi:hypothetical protein